MVTASRSGSEEPGDGDSNSIEPRAVQYELSVGNGDCFSTNVTQPALQGPLVYGTQRMEYKVGVTGCGQRRTYIVICPEGGTGCSATPRRR